ncbi:MAG: hypothetical protein QW217_08425 [Candidatus Caldarchaeum sp.]
MLFVGFPPLYITVPATIIWLIFYLKLGDWLEDVEEAFDHV